jgi:hypothetical protein
LFPLATYYHILVGGGRAGGYTIVAPHKGISMRSFECALVGLVLGIGVSPAFADETAPVHPVLHDRFYFGVGAFVPRMTTTAQLDSTSLGVGTNVDFEKALGMPAREVVPDFFARYRFDERWRIDAEYFAVNRSGNRTVDRDIQWGDHVFPANTQLNSTFDFSDTRVSVGYSFFRTADKEAGAGFGFHVAKYRTSLSAAVVGNESGDTLAPLPVLSAYAQFALTEEWARSRRLVFHVVRPLQRERQQRGRQPHVPALPQRGFWAWIPQPVHRAHAQHTRRNRGIRPELQGAAAVHERQLLTAVMDRAALGDESCEVSTM